MSTYRAHELEEGWPVKILEEIHDSCTPVNESYGSVNEFTDRYYPSSDDGFTRASALLNHRLFPVL